MNDLIMWSPGVTLAQIERQVVQKAYSWFRKNKTQTANALGISVRTLDTRLEEIQKEAQDQTARLAAETKKRTEHLNNARRNHVAINAAAFGGNGTIDFDAQGSEGSALKDSGAEAGPSGDSRPGVPMESSAAVAAQQPVPVPERGQVQDVLSSKVAASGSRRGR